jgi:very-short-patch-repair endonuclease
MGVKTGTAERVIALIASRAHGVATRAQLQSAGITPKQIERRLDKGALIRVYRGVYRVGHSAPSVEATYLAAILACGDSAALAGRAGAHHLALTRGVPPAPEVVAATERRVPGVRTRRSRALRAGDVIRHRGIPVVRPAWLLVDLAAALDEDRLARACHEAGVRYGTTPAQVEAVLARRPNAPGARVLRRILHGDVHVTLSRLERRFLELLREEGLPLPVTNRSVDGRRVDCRWPDHALTVELDGYRYHRSRHAWEQDRLRERAAYARGDDFRRYTPRDVFEDRHPMLGELHALIPRKQS